MSAKDSRIKRNLISSLVYQVVLISLSFILPRLYLENFGSEVNGVLSTIKQIFTYMCLLEAGVGFENVCKTTCFLADMGDFAAFNAVYEKYFVSKPARSCVAVKTLPKGLLCEIEAIAEK